MVGGLLEVLGRGRELSCLLVMMRELNREVGVGAVMDLERGGGALVVEPARRVVELGVGMLAQLVVDEPQLAVGQLLEHVAVDELDDRGTRVSPVMSATLARISGGDVRPSVAAVDAMSRAVGERLWSRRTTSSRTEPGVGRRS